MCSPSWDTVCPAQSRRKSLSRHTLDGAGRSESDEAEEADGTGIPRVAGNEARPAGTPQVRRRFGRKGGSLCRDIKGSTR
ncbi:hypothetical protein GCM10010424_54530 [Streptomyces lienomycini]